MRSKYSICIFHVETLLTSVVDLYAGLKEPERKCCLSQRRCRSGKQASWGEIFVFVPLLKCNDGLICCQLVWNNSRCYACAIYFCTVSTTISCRNRHQPELKSLTASSGRTCRGLLTTYAFGSKLIVFHNVFHNAECRRKFFCSTGY